MKPVLQAILVAEHVYEDRATGKKIVAGIFRNFHISKTNKKRVVDGAGKTRTLIQGGMNVGSPYGYVSLTSIRGNQRFVVRYVRLNDEKPFFHTEFAVECDNPLNVVEVVLPLPLLPTEPGHYALELLCEDEPIGAFRIAVELIEEGDEDHDSSL